MPPFAPSIYCLLEYLTDICILFQLTGKLHYFFIIAFYGPRMSLCLKDIQPSRLQTSAEGDPIQNGTNTFLLSFLGGWMDNPTYHEPNISGSCWAYCSCTTKLPAQAH